MSFSSSKHFFFTFCLGQSWRPELAADVGGVGRLEKRRTRLSCSLLSNYNKPDCCSWCLGLPEKPTRPLVCYVVRDVFYWNALCALWNNRIYWERVECSCCLCLFHVWLSLNHIKAWVNLLVSKIFVSTYI